jgi:hypothetical protein
VASLGAFLPDVRVCGVSVTETGYLQACRAHRIAPPVVEVSPLVAARFLFLSHPVQALALIRTVPRWESITPAELCVLLGAKDHQWVRESLKAAPAKLTPSKSKSRNLRRACGEPDLST